MANHHVVANYGHGHCLRIGDLSHFFPVFTIKQNVPFFHSHSFPRKEPLRAGTIRSQRNDVHHHMAGRHGITPLSCKCHFILTHTPASIHNVPFSSRAVCQRPLHHISYRFQPQAMAQRDLFRPNGGGHLYIRIRLMTLSHRDVQGFT